VLGGFLRLLRNENLSLRPAAQVAKQRVGGQFRAAGASQGHSEKTASVCLSTAALGNNRCQTDAFEISAASPGTGWFTYTAQGPPLQLRVWWRGTRAVTRPLRDISDGRNDPFAVRSRCPSAEHDLIF
jgi:hypothetical protein